MMRRRRRQSRFRKRRFRRRYRRRIYRRRRAKTRGYRRFRRYGRRRRSARRSYKCGASRFLKLTCFSLGQNITFSDYATHHGTNDYGNDRTPFQVNVNSVWLPIPSTVTNLKLNTWNSFAYRKLVRISWKIADCKVFLKEWWNHEEVNIKYTETPYIQAGFKTSQPPCKVYYFQDPWNNTQIPPDTMNRGLCQCGVLYHIGASVLFYSIPVQVLVYSQRYCPVVQK